MTKADLNEHLVTSPDQNRERLEALKTLFPDLFTDEGELNPSALRQLVERTEAGGREQYAFTWHGKSRAKRHAFTPSRAALTYDTERSVNPDKANGNMIIEGENLEVLKLLIAAYRERVKCIYIDPPYNTGGDFIYPDDYSRDRKEYWEENGAYQNGVKMDTNPETSGRYHSDWLSMMYSRLLIARQLLREDGVIFVSIDDNEIHNLRKILDEIFGEENFAGTAIWQRKYSPQNDAKSLSAIHEYICVYARDLSAWTPTLLPRSDKALARYKNLDDDPRGRWKTGDLTSKTKASGHSYPITTPTGKVHYPSQGRQWAPAKSTFEKLLEDNRIWFGKSGDNVPALKQFLSEVLPGTVPTTLWLRNQVGDNQEAVRETSQIGIEFDSPKPIRLIKHIIKIGTVENEENIVLDFFSGSGTTGQAVLDLNEEDGGNRQFIMVQLPETIDEKHEAYKADYRIISDVCIDRCKRVIEGYRDDLQPLDAGFKVYRLTKSHFPRVEFQPDPDKSEEENIEALKRYIAEKEASFQLTFDRDKIFDEVLLKHGFMLDYSLSKQDEFEENTLYLADDGTRQALICLDLSLDEKTIEMFKERTERPFICLERALDTTMKWNLKHFLGDRLKAI